MVSCENIEKSTAVSVAQTFTTDPRSDVESLIDNQIENILEWSHNIFGSEQLILAKEEFYTKMGKIFPEDDFFNRRISYFVDYFLFERPLRSKCKHNSMTPFNSYKELEGSPKIQRASHSIYQVLKVNQKSLHIEDLISGERFKIEPSDHTSFEGIVKKDLFQGFIYDVEDQTILSRGLVFHNAQVHGLIKKHLKMLRKNDLFNREQILSLLARTHLRHIRHSHVSAKRFYEKELNKPI
jgi:hypothetical protein